MSAKAFLPSDYDDIGMKYARATGTLKQSSKIVASDIDILLDYYGNQMPRGAVRLLTEIATSLRASLAKAEEMTK